VKLAARIVGTALGPLAQAIDARWLMAYAAALGETDPRYFDTLNRNGPLVAHPLFPVCYEWPAAVAARERTIPPEVYARVVHATHDLTIHRAPRAGDTLLTTARIIGAVQRAPGAFVVTRMETRDAAGDRVSVTDYGSLYRGVTLEGADPAIAPALEEAPIPAEPLPAAGTVPVAADLSHVYTECARIWNPIHTDLAVARAAGLPGLILHGTATLALSVSRVLAACDIDVTRVRRVRCRFTGMVPMPARLEVGAQRAGNTLLFETACNGSAVLSRGAIDLV
jgi:acyl dehydratase